MAEAGNQPIEGMMAVAQTIRDRAELWGMAPTKVVTQPSQYAKPYQGDVSSNVIMAVSAVFDSDISVFDDPVTHFHSGDEPYWTEGKVNRGSIGKHTFYY